MPDEVEPHPGQITLEGAAIIAANAAKDAVPTKVRHLRPVETGELHADEPQTLGEAITALRDVRLELEGLEEAHRSAMAKVRILRRDRNREARRDGLWPLGVEAFAYWQAQTGHGKSVFTPERFWLVRPYLLHDGIELVKLAIDGAAFDPYRADRPNRAGRLEVFDSWETIFKSRGAFERHCNRAPAERVSLVRECGLAPILDPLSLRVKAEVILTHELGDDPRPMPVKVAEALESARLELTRRRM